MHHEYPKHQQSTKHYLNTVVSYFYDVVVSYDSFFLRNGCLFTVCLMPKTVAGCAFIPIIIIAYLKNILYIL